MKYKMEEILFIKVVSTALYMMGFLYSISQKYPDNVRRGSAVGIVTGYGLDDRWAGVRLPVRSRFSLLHIVQTCSVMHLTYPVGTGVFFHRGEKAFGA
jgi:hypothetical protein